MITLGSLFDGIGGALLCAKMCGAVPIWASEIEPFPIKVTKHHFPEVKHLGDITKINGAEIEPVDIIVGGSPCQDLSVAGKRAGMAGARSGLFMNQVQIVKEMRDATNGARPRYMVWENVPGAMSSNSGEDFRAVLEETARIADSAISIPRSEAWSNAGSVMGNGFSISWRIIDAQYWGVPQRRRRIYLVADFGGQSAPEILFEQPCMSGDSAESGNEGKRTTEDVERSVGEAVAIDAYNHAVTGDIAVTLTAASGSSATHSGPMCMVAPLNTIDRHAVCFSNSGFSNYQKDDVAATQRACVAKQTDVDLVCYGVSSYESNAMKSNNPHSGIYEADTARTIDQNGGNPACNQGGIIIFEPRSQDGTPRVSTDNLRPTLNTAQGGQRQPCIATYSFQRSDELEESEVACTQSARQYKSATDLVSAARQVRRLTPLECERLQGYPDNYTNIPGASDSARYKALGNSFERHCALFVIGGCVHKLREAHHDQSIYQWPYSRYAGLQRAGLHGSREDADRTRLRRHEPNQAASGQP